MGRQVSALPDFLLEKATRRGIPAEEARRLWTGHTAWCDAHGKDYGGMLWDALLTKFIERVKNESKLDDSDAELTKRLADEREAKARADAEYAKTAISLRDWVASLKASQETLLPHERAIAEQELPQGHEDAAQWLLAVLSEVKGIDGKPPSRPNPCGHPDCGLPAHSWIGLGGRRYSSGRCVDHTPKEDWRIR